MFGGQGGGKNSGDTTKGSVIVGDLELIGTDAGGGPDFGSGKRGAKVKKFEAHIMYDPKTGKGYKANKPADHKRMKKLGYLHADEMKKTSKAQVGDQISGVDGAKGDQDGSPMNFMQRASSELGDEDGFFQKVGGKALSDVFKFKDMFEAQKEQERRLEQQLKITDLSVTAAKSQPEKIAKRICYVQKISQTQEKSSFQCMV